jgi:type 1 glutamine amidotransferase
MTMKTSLVPALSLLTLGLLWSPAQAADEIPAAQARQIYAAAPAQARVAPRQARRVLVWNTPAHLMDKDPHKGYCIPYGTSAFQALGKKTGAYQPVVSDELALFLPENLAQFDAIVLNNASGPWITPTDADLAKEAFKKHGTDKAALEQRLRQALLDYVARGGGLVGIHYAIGANSHWPEFRALLGGTFIGHPWNEEVKVNVEEPGHPLAAAFGGKDFRLADEIYEFGEPFARERVRVLLSLDTERSNMGVKWIHRKDNDFALAWVKTYGKGRVFNTSFGHRTELFWHPQLLQFYLDAIQFAAGDLPAPTEPRLDRPVKRAPGPTPPAVRAEKMQAKKIIAPTEQQIQKMQTAAPEKAPVKPAKRRKVLIWGHSWAHEPNPFAEQALQVLGRKSGAFEPVVTDDPRLLLGDALPTFDALVMNNIHERDPFLPDAFATLDAEQQAAAKKFDAAVKQSILEYVRSGKGIVGLHAATAAFQNWPEYGEMMGGFYGSHILQEVIIKPEEPGHPLNACFERKPWRITDEIYIAREPYSRAKLRVLLSLDLGQMSDPGKRADKDYAVSWVRPYGQGRVFYTTLGHVAETYWNPLFLRHVLAGIQFATGDLPAEASPRQAE